jgi:hypothetical protein
MRLSTGRSAAETGSEGEGAGSLTHGSGKHPDTRAGIPGALSVGSKGEILMRNMRLDARCIALVACLGLIAGLQAAVASAHTGEFAKFDYCPSTNVEVKKCIYSVTESGEVVLGSKKVPIVNPVTVQGGFGKANAETHYSQFYAATNGVTISKTPQPVPGGLAGLVNCKEISDWFLRISCEVTFENGLTGVNSTLELARPASEIKISELYLLFGEAPALILPVKVHLENPFLGSNCYVGSSSSPIWFNLTTGKTEPPPPNTSISGSTGSPGSLEEGLILTFSGQKLVDNAWSAPGASGCGGVLFEWLLDPIINLSSGVPSAAGHNTAILTGTSYTAASKTVNAH